MNTCHTEHHAFDIEHEEVDALLAPWDKQLDFATPRLEGVALIKAHWLRKAWRDCRTSPTETL